MKGKAKDFLIEAEEILGSIDRDVMHLSRCVNKGSSDPTLLNSLFRSVHTLKGLSGVFEFSDIARLCHALEDTLELLRLGRVKFDSDSIEAITLAEGLLSKMVCSGRASGFGKEVASVIEVLGKYVDARDRSEDMHLGEKFFASLTEYENFRLRDNMRAGRKIFVVCASFETKSFDRLHHALTEELGKVAEIITTLPSAGKDPGKIRFEMLIATTLGRKETEDLIQGFKGISLREIKYESMGTAGGRLSRAVVQRKTAAKRVETMRRNTGTIRVDVVKIENLMGCLDELYGLKTRLRRLTTDMAEGHYVARSADEFRDLGKRCDEVFDRIRDGVLAVKMVRVGRLFRRFEPYIERLANECGKEIGITTYGGDTEIDMSVIEELADPLMHIIRNVIDHGIEAPSERVACGKSSAGVVTMSAYQKGGKVVLEVKDDGRGMDPEEICRKALSAGFIERDEADALGRHEKLDLIFLPGFSTTDEVGHVSGRGVGLDVVRENIALINGLVEVETVSGKGTRFILTIPVTQTMIGALLCEAGGNSFAIPGSCVSEIIALGDDVSLSDGFITIDNTSIRAVRPSELFNPARAEPDHGSSYAVLASVGQGKICIVVDRVLKEFNMVLRPLPFEDRISGVLGLAEGPDNEAALVLDIPGIMEVLSIQGKDPWDTGQGGHSH